MGNERVVSLHLCLAVLSLGRTEDWFASAVFGGGMEETRESVDPTFTLRIDLKEPRCVLNLLNSSTF